MDKESRDRISEYYKEVLKSKHEYSRATLWTILVVGSGVFGLLVSNDFSASLKIQLMTYIGFSFVIGSIFYLFILMKQIRFFLDLLKKL